MFANAVSCAMAHLAATAPPAHGGRLWTSALLVVGAVFLTGCELLLAGKNACVVQADCYAPYVCQSQQCVVAIDAVGRNDGGREMVEDAGRVALDGGPLVDAGKIDDAGADDAGRIDVVSDGGHLDGGTPDGGPEDGGNACVDASCADWRRYLPCASETECGAALQCVAFDLYLLNRMCVPGCEPVSFGLPRGGCPEDPSRGVWCLTASSIGDERVDDICVAHPDADDAILVDPAAGTVHSLSLTASNPVVTVAMVIQSGPLPVTLTVSPSSTLDILVKSTAGSGIPLQTCDDGLEGEQEVCGLLLEGPARHHFRIEGYDGTLGDFQLSLRTP